MSTPDPGWVPFVTAAPLWAAWPLLIVPLLLGIALAYKATKSPTPVAAVLDAGRLALLLFIGLTIAAITLVVGVDVLSS